MARIFRILGKRGRITIPFEIRQRVGFSYNDVLSFEEASDGRSVTVKREKICDNCRHEKQPETSEDTVTLFDFLNGLTPEQQRAALAHLKLKYERSGGIVLDGRP
ncbi:MAG: AbrB/MazE/SpoVT family DNA-binding domain-containing protein [Clostridia bacterium]|nr:AbrB/MazE/SpoVT family DNA-binding domain-containing protein [Clostridia bacterium]